MMILAAQDTAGYTFLATFADGLAILCLALSLFFFVVGAVGMIRLPDVYHRIHAISKCTTLGMLGMLLAAILHVGTIDVVMKSILTLIFAFVATPVGTHILARAALTANNPLWPGTLSNDHEEDLGSKS